MRISKAKGLSSLGSHSTLQGKNKFKDQNQKEVVRKAKEPKKSKC
jgi:hypothetical protein